MTHANNYLGLVFRKMVFMYWQGSQPCQPFNWITCLKHLEGQLNDTLHRGIGLLLEYLLGHLL